MQLVGFSHDGTPYPMFLALLGCALAALAAIGTAYLAPRRREAVSPAVG